MMRTYIIDGNKFSNIEGLFDEIDLIMTKGISFKTGHNLNKPSSGHRQDTIYFESSQIRYFHSIKQSKNQKYSFHPDGRTNLLYAIKHLLLVVLVILTNLRPPWFLGHRFFSFIFSRTPKTKISPQDTKRTPFSQKLSKISICQVM